MAKNDKKTDLIIAMITLLIGSILIIYYVIRTISIYKAYSSCSSNESLLCFQWACDTTGPLCGNAAIRYDEDGNYYCSYAPRTPNP